MKNQLLRIFFSTCLWLLMKNVAGKHAIRDELEHFNHTINMKRARKISAASSKVRGQDTERGIFLRVVSNMKNQSATSGDAVQFKCRVNGWPKDDIDYTWYKENVVLGQNSDTRRISISIKPWGSRLKIKDLFTHDSGWYRCETSNGLRSVSTSAYLTVNFQRPPPPPNEEHKRTMQFPLGRCEKYRGMVCSEFLTTNEIYVDSFENQDTIEEQLLRALNRISNTNYITSRCQKVAVPAFCYFMFPLCTKDNKEVKSGGYRLCREDCEMLKLDWCHSEYLNSKHDSFLQKIFNTANCSLLHSVKHSQCISLGISSQIEKEKCSNGNDAENAINKSNIFYLVIPMCIGTFVLIIATLYCACYRKKKHVIVADRMSEANSTKIPLLAKYAKISELNQTSIHLIHELGSGYYGKVYKGLIIEDLPFSSGKPVAVKCLQDGYTKLQLKEFKQEMDVMSQLFHPHILCFKAMVMQENLKCLVFDYTEQVDLHEYLSLHFTQNDSFKISFHNNHRQTNSLAFMEMASQVASGMEYLSTNNFIHRDLAARNILVHGNMELKISNLGIVRNSHLSSYYKEPHSERMLPIRWMAPESFDNWQFSDKTAIWSFGVLLWEIFCFGMQPYCEFSNEEVLKMIPHYHLLTCPDQCPAKVYLLMQECWSHLPAQRPAFSDIVIKLSGWINNKADITAKNCSHYERDAMLLWYTPTPPPEYTSEYNAARNQLTSSERSYPSDQYEIKERTEHHSIHHVLFNGNKPFSLGSRNSSMHQQSFL